MDDANRDQHQPQEPPHFFEDMSPELVRIYLEQERQETIGTLEFQNWMKELNVSQSYEDPTLKHNAGDLMRQYDAAKYSKLNFKNN